MDKNFQEKCMKFIKKELRHIYQISLIDGFQILILSNEMYQLYNNVTREYKAESSPSSPPACAAN